jgi:hypothetical protein
MANRVFPNKSKKTPQSKLENVTLRGFGGGWNAVDDDLSMQPRYVKTLKNFVRTASGGQAIRFGNNFFVDIKGTHNSDIVDIVYYNNRLVCVCEDGWVVTITDGGTQAAIWNPTIAAALPGSPGFWGSTFKSVSFVPFKNKLVIHNGVDKPIIVSSAFAVTYLQDEGTGSNVNTPIGKFGCTAANYHCVAGFDASPTEIVISAVGTVGTFPLDPDPNDAISIDVGAYAPEGAASIRGIAGYRSFLIVFLQEITLQVKLGVYDDTGNHKPEFPDSFPKFGLVGNRCITTIENDLIFSGLQGLSSAKRNTYATGQLDSSTVSSVIEPEYQRIMGELTDEEKQIGTFSIYDRLGHNLVIYTPDGNALVYSSNEKLRYKSWSFYESVAWRCGCTTLLGRVFLCDGTKIFQHGNNTFGERYYADRMNDRDANWATATAYTVGALRWDTVTEESYTCSVSHTSGGGTFLADRETHPDWWTLYEGEPISFEMEMPWFDGKDPMKVKQLRFISVGTRGTAEFTVQMYVDNLYKNFEGTQVYDPALSMTFIGNDAPGYGEDVGPYGGGRRSNDPNLWSYNAKFKMAKFRIIGSTIKPLEVINFSFLYAKGRYSR